MQSSWPKKIQHLRNLSKLSPPAHVGDLQAAVHELCKFDRSVPCHVQIQILLYGISIAIGCGMQSGLATALPPLRHRQRALSGLQASDNDLRSTSTGLVELRSSLGGTDAGALVECLSKATTKACIHTIQDRHPIAAKVPKRALVRIHAMRMA